MQANPRRRRKNQVIVISGLALPNRWMLWDVQAALNELCVLSGHPVDRPIPYTLTEKGAS